MRRWLLFTLVLMLFPALPLRGQHTVTKLLSEVNQTGGLFGFALDAGHGHLLIGGPTDCVPRQDGHVHSQALDGAGWHPVGTPVAGLCAGYAIDVAGIRAVIGQPFGHRFRAVGSAQVLAQRDGAWEVVAYLSGDEDVASGFGAAVALSGNRIAVGAPQANRVFVFEEQGTDWTLVAVLASPTPNATDRFGFAVALDGDRLVVGAPGTRNRPEPAHESGEAVYESGAAYLYENTGGIWQLRETWQDEIALTFGSAVALLEDHVAIGSPSSLTAINAGLVRLYDHVVGQWVAGQTLSFGGAGLRFGHALRLASGVLMVGAPGDLGPGSAHLYQRGEAGWEEAARLISDDDTGADGFGTAVAMDGGAFFVGAPFDAEAGAEAGAVYRFEDVFETAIEEEPMTTALASFTLTPNPNAGQATLRFSLPEAAEVRAEWFDIRGARVGVLTDQRWPAGAHTWPVAMEPWASGVYLLRIWVDGQATTHTVTLIR